MGCGVRHAGCGLCAPAARGRGRERSGEGRGRGARAAARDSIADGTALRCGRVGSRHFEKPLGFVLGASFFVCIRHKVSFY